MKLAIYSHKRFQSLLLSFRNEQETTERLRNLPYRLPDTVRPINYALRMQPLLEPPFTLFGKEDIDIEV